MLSLIISGIALVPAYGYYSNVYLPSTHPSQPDPFTTLWNGQIPSTVSSTVAVGFNDICTANVNCVSTAFSTSGKDVIVVVGWACSTGAISDSQGNTWSTLGSVTGYGNWSLTTVAWGFFAIDSKSGSDTVTWNCNGFSGYVALAYHGFTSLGNEHDSGSLLVPDPNPQTISVSSGSIALEVSIGFRQTLACPTVSQTSPTPRHTDSQCGINGTNNSYVALEGDSGPFNSAQSVTQTGTFTNIAAFWHSMIELKGRVSPPCSFSGYQCLNASILSGNIQLTSNATFPGIAMSNDSIDLSTGASKAIAFGIMNVGNVVTSSNGVGAEFGWFLRQNGTLPNTPFWSPTNDSSVVLLETLTVTANKFNYYLYMQRSLGQRLFIGSENPSCSQVYSLFLCASNTTNNSPTFTPLVLNYTGASTGTGTAPGQSYLCTDTGGGATTCNFGGVNNAAIALANTILRINFTQPWLNLQNNYYVGYWQRANYPLGTTLSWATSNSQNTNNVISVFTPGGSTLNPDIAEGGFFGWVGRSLGGAWNAVAGTLGPIVAPALNLGNSLLAAFVSALIQAGNLLIQGLTVLESIMVAAMNAIGNFIGWGNVGTSMQQLITALVTLFTNGSVTTFFGDLPTVIGRFIDYINVAVPWLPIAFNTASNVILLGVNAIVFIPTLVQFTFFWVSGVFVTVLILFWFIYTGDDALGGMLAFLETAEWFIFGLGVGLVSNIVNFFLDIVTYLIGLIPKPFVQMVAHAIPRLPIVDTGAHFVSPSFDLGEVRAGNMLSILSWMIGLTFLDWYEQVTPALPGSIGALLPSAAASLTGLTGLLPLLEILTAFVGLAALVFWPLTRMMEYALGDIGNIPLTMGPGRRLNAGPSGIRLRVGGKRFQGRLEKKLGERKEAAKQAAEIKAAGASSMGIG